MASNQRTARPRAAKSMPAAQLRKKAQRLTSVALKTLESLMATESTPATIKLTAAREVLDRGHGRPPLGGSEPGGQGGGMTVIVKRYSEVTEDELARAAEGEP
jgi:hypothetical protein